MSDNKLAKEYREKIWCPNCDSLWNDYQKEFIHWWWCEKNYKTIPPKLLEEYERAAEKTVNQLQQEFKERLPPQPKTAPISTEPVPDRYMFEKLGSPFQCGCVVGWWYTRFSLTFGVKLCKTEGCLYPNFI